jgi:hypothetical protein
MALDLEYYVKMKSGLIRLMVVGLIAVFLTSFSETSRALNTKTSFCKSMLNEIKMIDDNGLKLFDQYSRDYALARKTNLIEDNLVQTRSLLDLYENDRTLFLRALESRKCFTATELLNLEEALANATADAISVKSWIEVLTGIPGRKFYSSYVKLPKYLSKATPWHHCAKKGTKYKTLTCKMHEGKLRWIDASYSTNTISTPSWPTDFIDDQVNLIEAKKRILKYFEDNSVVASSSGIPSVEFMKRTSYPGLFDFEVDPKLTACKEFASLQDNAGPIKVKYVVSEENIKPNPNWVISDGSRGELIVNRKFRGQVFTVPVRIEISKGDWSEPGTFANRHVAILDGVVYRFSAC